MRHPSPRAPDARSGRIYVTTINRLAAFDLTTEKMVWEKTFDGGCDRLAISTDGKTIYLPSLEGPFWNVVDAASGMGENLLGVARARSDRSQPHVRFL